MRRRGWCTEGWGLWLVVVLVVLAGAITGTGGITTASANPVETDVPAQSPPATMLALQSDSDLDVTGDGNPATDPDGDGRYEDVNGDGDVTPGDATVLFNAIFEGNAVVSTNRDRFDVNGDGMLAPGDATVLFEIALSPEPTGRQVTVTRVVDGDTIEIAYPNGTADTVRFLGVDTPEVHTETDPDEFEGVPNTSAGRSCLRAAGENASGVVTDRLDGETVTLRFDDAADRRGVFGRLLAYIHHDGTNLNYRLVADGHARVYDSTFTQSDRFYEAEADAQAAERGVWDCRDVTSEPPSDDGSADVRIARIHADAAGDEYENLNDEYVVIENAGDSAVDLGGWSIDEGDGRRYTFPDGFGLDAGATVTVHTGSGSDTSTDLYWGSESPLWNNGGDTGTLSDASGTVVDQLTYS